MWAERVSLSWQLLAELARRHPNGVIKHDWHHISDALICSFRDEGNGGEVVCARNLGSIHVDLGDDAGGGYRRLAIQGPRKVARAIETVTGRHATSTTPPSTPRSLTYRVLAGICRISQLDGFLLNPLWGINYDSNDVGEEPHPHFGCFPDTESRRRFIDDDDGGLAPEHRFWFLQPTAPPFRSVDRNQPAAVVETTGMMWDKAGAQIDLVAAYQTHDRDITRLVSFLYGRLDVEKPSPGW